MPTLPITFRASPLPEDFRGTPQELLDAIIERLAADTQDALALFASGSTQPTSNVGPWLKDGKTWYTWDTDSATYIPQPLDKLSLRYIITDTSPDHNSYDVWIKVDGSLNGLGILTYNGTAWVDVYASQFANYSSTSAMNAAIAAAAPISYPVNAWMTGAAQTVNVSGLSSSHKIAFNDKLFDPNSCFDTVNNRYVCPVKGIYHVDAKLQIDGVTEDQTHMEWNIRVGINGNDASQRISGGLSLASPPGRRWYPSTSGIIDCNAADYLEIFLAGDDGTNTGHVSVSNSNFSIYLVQKT